MEQREKVVVIGEDGKPLNLREDLPKEERILYQEVTVSKTRIVCNGPYLTFVIEFCEREKIEINISKIRELFSMMEVENQEDMEGKRLICYYGIDNMVWTIASVEKDWIMDIIGPIPRKKEDIPKYYMNRLPSDEEWRAFCQKQKQCQE